MNFAALYIYKYIHKIKLLCPPASLILQIITFLKLLLHMSFGNTLCIILGSKLRQFFSLSWLVSCLSKIAAFWLGIMAYSFNPSARRQRQVDL